MLSLKDVDHLLIRRTCGHVDVGTCPHQVLAATLTLSQPGGRLCPPYILVSTPSFENHRRAYDLTVLLICCYECQFLADFNH